jgi:hypothetical protein
MEQEKLKSSGDSVLNALDKWVGERFRKAYTHYNHERLVRGTLEAISQFDPDSMFETRAEVPRYLSSGYLAGRVSAIFSKGFSGLEEFLSDEDDPDFDAGNIPEEVIIGYVNPYIKSYEALKRLVQNVRDKFDDKFPYELSKEDINSSAREIFPNESELADFFDNMTRALILQKYSRIGTEESLENEADFLNAIYDKTKGPIGDIYRRMFGDLYEGR